MGEFRTEVLNFYYILLLTFFCEMTFHDISNRFVVAKDSRTFVFMKLTLKLFIKRSIQPGFYWNSPISTNFSYLFNSLLKIISRLAVKSVLIRFGGLHIPITRLALAYYFYRQHLKNLNVWIFCAAITIRFSSGKKTFRNHLW